jgi:hypothetical protein
MQPDIDALRARYLSAKPAFDLWWSGGYSWANIPEAADAATEFLNARRELEAAVGGWVDAKGERVA